MSTNSTKHETSALPLVWGASDIGKVIGLTNRQTFYLLERDALPARKVGGRWCADRRELETFFKNPQPDKPEKDKPA